MNQFLLKFQRFVNVSSDLLIKQSRSMSLFNNFTNYKKNYSNNDDNSMSLLTNNNNSIHQIINIRTYKPKTRLRKRCKHCEFTWKNGRLYVECKENPRHKQFHMKSFLRGFDNIPFGFDPKANDYL
jgi:ribosomal protein L36